MLLGNLNGHSASEMVFSMFSLFVKQFEAWSVCSLAMGKIKDCWILLQACSKVL